MLRRVSVQGELAQPRFFQRHFRSGTLGVRGDRRALVPANTPGLHAKGDAGSEQGRDVIRWML